MTDATETMTRWSLVVSSQTDRRLRALLGERGARKGAISRYVQEAVERRLFEDTVKTVQERNTRYPEAEIMAAIDEAVTETRAAPRS